jgi:arylsulfatase A-like enzyme
VTLDTTRADYVGSYGFALPTSPHLDGLAARGVRFETAVAQVPLTGPSHATILTGLFPHEHGAIRNGVPLPREARTLAEVMREAGYRTGAFLSGWTLRANLSGLDQGFELYDDSMTDRYRMVNTQRFAHQVTPLAVAWLEANQAGPFFLWVHYFDPHAPYTKQPRLYQDLPDGHAGLKDRDARYASEIRHADEGLGELLRALDRLGLAGDTLVVVTADHGESLGEHGYVGHGQYLYEEILRVPLVIGWPGRLPEGKVVRSPVALLDLAPTVLSLLGLPPLPRHSGADLSLLIEADRESRSARQIRFELYPGARKGFFGLFASKVSPTPTMLGYRERDLKYVYHVQMDYAQVFDLTSPEGEEKSLADRYPALAASGRDLVAWVEATSSVAIADSELSPEDAARLRSLGYND